MPKKCSICFHPECEAIERSLLDGLSYREISERFEGLNKSSICRHKKHIGAVLAKAEEAKDLTRADNLLEETQRLREKAMRIAAKAEAKGDLLTALAGIRELTRIVELMAKLRGEIQEQQINILVSHQWLEMRTVLLDALEPFPEARLKLAEVLKNAN